MRIVTFALITVVQVVALITMLNVLGASTDGSETGQPGTGVPRPQPVGPGPAENMADFMDRLDTARNTAP